MQFPSTGRPRVSDWARSLSALGVVVSLAAVTGCASSGATEGKAIEVAQFKADEGSAPREYVIRIGDLLSVQVYSDEKASGRSRVRSDGRISLPLINDVDAAGKTPVQLAADIENHLKTLLVTPRVTVSVEESSPLTVSVLGEVTKPGTQPLQNDAGVADALAAAGGLTRFAHKNRIYVVRTTPEAMRIHFTYGELTGTGPAARFRLRPGDVVVVE